MSKDAPVEAYLRKLVGAATPGARLPTVRDLMVRFGVSQLIVQRAFQTLRSEGLMQSHVGRGTFVAGSEGGIGSWPAGRRRSKGGEGPGILMLTRNSGSDRTVWVLSQTAKATRENQRQLHPDHLFGRGPRPCRAAYTACVFSLHSTDAL